PRAVAAAAAAPAPIRINAGGPAYTDASGIRWSADAYYAGGTASTASFAVANTTSDPLYSARRWGASFGYNVPVAAAGTYTVKLYFADPLYTASGKRKFTVRAEGQTVLSNFDIAANGGGKAAIVKSFAASVTDGTLNLTFANGVGDNPIVSAIEVMPQAVPPATPGVGKVAGLTLIDAKTDAAIGQLTNGAVLDVAAGNQYAVRADPSGSVGSVKFLLDGQPVRVESTAPLSVSGDANGDYPAWGVPAGSHTLTVVPYSGAGATGTAGTAYSASFTVTSATVPPPVSPPPVSPPPVSPPPVSPPPVSPPPVSPPPVSPPPVSPPPATAFTTINYANKAANPLQRAEALTATWNGRLYVFGGFNVANGPVVRSDYYNPAANSWTRIADLPQRMTHVGVAQDDQNAYFVAGYVGTAGGTGYGQTFGSNKVWRYNFASNTFSAMPNLPRALAGGGAAIVGRELHYFGGQEGGSRVDTTVHLVLNLDNPSAGWTARKAMAHGRSHLAAAVVDGKIYAIAGQVGNDEKLTTQKYVEVYDPATETWAAKTSIPKAVSHVSSAVIVIGGRIIVMGGESAHNVQVRDVYAYNPATDAWSALTPLPAARFSGAAGVIGGKVYFSTGGSQATTWEGTPA
ncbi:MAG: Kelch repeat type 1-containing protein, partial [Phycisphaerales bacterium]|nr:Kelch repeat type 1-containing protein [Phycisphaerales bacterium]